MTGKYDGLQEIIDEALRDMAAKAVFYAVRNAFAHGSFEVTSPVGGEERIYLLEAAKDGVPKARVRLKESKMQELLHIGGLNKSNVKQMQHKGQR